MANRRVMQEPVPESNSYALTDTTPASNGYIIKESTLRDIAEAIREKTGIAEAIQVSNISSIIRDELGTSEDLSGVIAEQEQLIAELEAELGL